MLIIVIIALYLILDKRWSETVLLHFFCCSMLPASVILKVLKEIMSEMFIRNINLN